MKRWSLVLGLLFLVVPPAWGQTALWVGGGYTHTSNQDMAAAPITYRGGARPLAVGVFWERGRWRHWIEAQGASTVIRNAGALAASVDRFVDAWSYLEAAYGLERRSSRLSAGPVVGRAGARLHTFVFERGYDFQDGFSWEWMTTLDLGLSWSYARASRWQFDATIEGTVIGYVHRPPYFLASDALFAYIYDGIGTLVGFGGFYTIDTLRKGAVIFGAQRRLGRRLGVLAEARLLAHRFSLPEPTTTLQRGLSVHLLYYLR